MKRITIRYFALFREQAGTDSEVIEVDVATAADIFEMTQHRHSIKEPQGHCKVAINDVMADWNSPLQDGDTVLLFPPVAGG